MKLRMILSVRSSREVNSPRRSSRRVDREEQLDLVEPAGVGRGVGDGEPRVRGQPGGGGLGSVRRPVVQDQVDGAVGVDRLVDLGEERGERRGVVALDDVAQHLAVVHIEGGDQRHRAVVDVLELLVSRL